MVAFDPAGAAPRLASLGFLASSGMTGPDTGYLLIALRRVPSLHHYDPEFVDYWATEAERGTRRTLTRQTPLPIQADISWGPVRIVDRLGTSNEYLTFGGRLSAALIDDVVVAVVTSAAPVLKAGGHSQLVDAGAESVGAFFGRLLRAIDFVPGFEARVAGAEPLARYAAFLVDALDRFRASGGLRDAEPELFSLLEAEERRLRLGYSGPWLAGQALWQASIPAEAEAHVRARAQAG